MKWEGTYVEKEITKGYLSKFTLLLGTAISFFIEYKLRTGHDKLTWKKNHPLEINNSLKTYRDEHNSKDYQRVKKIQIYMNYSKSSNI